MKLFKSTLALAALLTIGSACAKTTTTGTAKKAAPAAKKAAPARKAAPAKKTPAKGRANQRQVAQPVSGFQQLRAQVLSMQEAEVYDKRGQLSLQFVTDIIEMSILNKLDKTALKTLLQTARDKFVPFSGDDEGALSLLRRINEQIGNAVKSFNESTYSRS